jgi:hypothetical protein
VKFTPNNFLTLIKELIMGGGLMKDGVTPKNDAGFWVDRNDMLDTSVLATGVTYISDGNSFPVLNVAATNTGMFNILFWVPRDYDEATDELHLKFVAKMAGSTDTPTVTTTGKKAVIGSAPAALTLASGGTTAALSTTATKFTVVVRGQGLKRDTLVEFTATSGAHGTDALQIQAIGVSYRSTLVSYNLTDTGNNKTGNNIRG